MTQEWDDILAQPMAQLQPDLPAADGGWRAVRPLDEVSPRPQTPPTVLPDGDLMLSVRFPAQPEEDRPAAEPPPPSLTEQLSLTWASRRPRNRRPVEEPVEPTWPAFVPSQSAAEEPEITTLPQAKPGWREPLQRIVRLLRREPSQVIEPVPEQTEAPEVTELPTQPTRQVARQDDVLETPRWVVDEAEVVQPRRSLDGDEALPLTLAQPRAETRPVQEETPPPAVRPAPRQEPTRAPATPEEMVERPEAVEPAQVVDETPRRRDGLFGRWLRRAAEPESAPGLEPEEPEPVSEVEDGFEATPLVHREESKAEPEPDQPVETAAVAEPQPVATPKPRDEQQAEIDAGEPLSPVLRERMEGLLDVPLREVRVFRNSISRRLTAAQQADAVTVGNEVHLAPGRGAPSTPSGQALMAHELSHYAARQTAEPGPVAPEREEARALQFEHAVGQRPDLPTPAAPQPVATPRLEHRATPSPRAGFNAAIASMQSMPGMYSAIGAMAGGGDTGGSSFSGGSGQMVMARAPIDRLQESAGSSGTTALAEEPALDEAADPQRDQQDETNLVERVVDAVLRKLRRESALEHERRGAFRSEIGG